MEALQTLPERWAAPARTSGQFHDGAGGTVDADWMRYEAPGLVLLVATSKGHKMASLAIDGPRRSEGFRAVAATVTVTAACPGTVKECIEMAEAFALEQGLVAPRRGTLAVEHG